MPGDWCGRVPALILQRHLRGPLGIMAGPDGRLTEMDRAYYSQRIGRGPLATPTVEDLGRALTLTVDEMWRRDYLQEWHGFHCVDAGEVEGRATMPLADHIEAETGWRSSWPLPTPLTDVLDDVRISEDDWNQLLQGVEDKLFDLIEYFHAHVSQGVEEGKDSNFHSYKVAAGTTGPSTQHHPKRCSASV